ncbi:MAG: hypothetical protein LBR35_01165 [Rickettsiales bacterium]|jgi:hypothetical protein|nr:hypothetical protein [Rickettsiales bacterium]
MEKKASTYFYLLVSITTFFLIIVFVLQNAITSHEKQLKKDIRQYSALFNENNLLQAEWTYSLKLENFNVFTNNRADNYRTILPTDNISIRELNSDK